MIRPDNLTGMAKASYDEYLRELALLINVDTEDKPSFYRHITDSIDKFVDTVNFNVEVMSWSGSIYKEAEDNSKDT